MGQHQDAGGALVNGPVAAAVTWVNDKVDGVTGHQAAVRGRGPDAGGSEDPGAARGRHTPDHARL